MNIVVANTINCLGFVALGAVVGYYAYGRLGQIRPTAPKDIGVSLASSVENVNESQATNGDTNGTQGETIVKQGESTEKTITNNQTEKKTEKGENSTGVVGAIKDRISNAIAKGRNLISSWTSWSLFR